MTLLLRFMLQGGGNITLTSETADVDTTAGNLDVSSDSGSDGNIVINAAKISASTALVLATLI